jgi:hypothetical protein
MYNAMAKFKGFSYQVSTESIARLLQNPEMKLYQLIDEDGDVSCMNIAKHLFKQAFMLSISLIYTVSLMHSPVVKQFIISAILYMLFVFVDIVKIYMINNSLDLHNCPDISDFYSCYRWWN